MRYVIYFSKEGVLRFTSHLDMIRFFKRAFKRAGIYLEHSQGFNPHPKMTFAQPLSLGFTAKSEILEIETKENLSPENLKKNLQKQMPEGMSITFCDYLSEKDKGIAGRIYSAVYRIKFPSEYHIDEEVISNFLKQNTIKVLKKQKKKKELKEIDIRPMIKSLEIDKSTNKTMDDHNIIMTTEVDCGSASNLNPELLVTALGNFTGHNNILENAEFSRLLLKY